MNGFTKFVTWVYMAMCLWLMHLAPTAAFVPTDVPTVYAQGFFGLCALIAAVTLMITPDD